MSKATAFDGLSNEQQRQVDAAYDNALAAFKRRDFEAAGAEVEKIEPFKLGNFREVKRHKAAIKEGLSHVKHVQAQAAMYEKSFNQFPSDMKQIVQSQYDEIQKNLAAGDFATAEKSLQALERRVPRFIFYRDFLLLPWHVTEVLDLDAHRQARELTPSLTPEKREMAKKLYKEATDAYMQKAYADALTRLDELHTIVPAYVTSRHMTRYARKQLEATRQPSGQ